MRAPDAVPSAEGPDPSDQPAPVEDPVLVRRARIARWVEMGQRLGYGLFGVAVVTFVVGFALGGLSDGASTLIVVALVVGSAVLAPAIVFGYAVRAADRADRENSW